MKKRSTFLPFVAAATLVLSACGGNSEASGGEGTKGADSPLVLAAVPSDSSDQSFKEAYQPLVNQISDATGRKVEFFVANSFAGVIEAQRTGKVDLAVYGPFGYYLAKKAVDNATPLVAIVRSAETKEAGYYSYAVVRDDSSIKSLADVDGKNVCFVDPGSSSGYLYPLVGLKKEGLEKGKDYKATFAGGHDASVFSVVAGDCDLGFAFDQMVDVLLPDKSGIGIGDKAKADDKRIRKVWTSPLIPAEPLVASGAVTDKEKNAITKSLTGMNAIEMAEAGYCDGGDVQSFTTGEDWGDQAGQKACKVALGDGWGWKKVDDEFYASIADVCRETKADVCSSGD